MLITSSSNMCLAISFLYRRILDEACYRRYETLHRKQYCTTTLMQLGELLTGLGRCLDSLGAAQPAGDDAEDGCHAEEQCSACCMHLRQAADHASTSDFVRQVGCLKGLQSGPPSYQLHTLQVCSNQRRVLLNIIIVISFSTSNCPSCRSRLIACSRHGDTHIAMLAAVPVACAIVCICIRGKSVIVRHP